MAQYNAATSTHRCKLQPPLFDGSYGKYEEWRNKFIADMALQHYEYVPLLHSSETATAALDETSLRGAATDQEQEERYTQMSEDLHNILVNICSVRVQAGAASGICGFETYRRLHLRYSLPLGARSVGYLTRLLQPKFDDKNFEETGTIQDRQSLCC